MIEGMSTLRGRGMPRRCLKAQFSSHSAPSTGVRLYRWSLRQAFPAIMPATSGGNDTLTGTNIKKIAGLKGYYRMAWVIAIISFVMMINSFSILSKRRLYKPFNYGSILAGGLTALHWLILMKAKRPVLAGVRAMILHENYDYFADGDLLKTMIPPEYARSMLLHYLLLVFILSLLMIGIRLFILYKGRPHRF